MHDWEEKILDTSISAGERKGITEVPKVSTREPHHSRGEASTLAKKTEIKFSGES